MGMCSGQLYKHNTRATPHLALQLVYFFSLPAKGVSSIARTELPYNERASSRPAVSQPLFWLVSFPFTSFLCVCVCPGAYEKANVSVNGARVRMSQANLSMTPSS
jgi:hypothetical protein